MWRGAVVGLAALVLVGGAGARTKLFRSDLRPLPPRYSEWVVLSDVPTPRGVLFLFQSPCPWYAAEMSCARPGAIWLDAADQTEAGFFHELGHVFDFRHLSLAERRTFMRLVKQTSEPWCGGQGWYEPCETFATAYASCAMGFAQDDGYERVCRFIRRAAYQ